MFTISELEQMLAKAERLLAELPPSTPELYRKGCERDVASQRRGLAEERERDPAEEARKAALYEAAKGKFKKTTGSSKPRYAKYDGVPGMGPEYEKPYNFNYGVR